jgi:hypothetical protein
LFYDFYAKKIQTVVALQYWELSSPCAEFKCDHHASMAIAQEDREDCLDVV